MKRISLAVILLLTACRQEHTPANGRLASGQPQASRSGSIESPSDYRNLIGSHHPPLPPGYKRWSAGLLEGRGGNPFAMQHVQRDGLHLFLLDSLTHRDAGGKPHFVILGLLAVPPFDSTTEALIEYDCFLDGRADHSIFAIGRWTDSGPHLEDVVDLRFAARPDIAAHGFELLTLSRVTCWVDEDRS